MSDHCYVWTLQASKRGTPNLKLELQRVCSNDRMPHPLPVMYTYGRKRASDYAVRTWITLRVGEFPHDCLSRMQRVKYFVFVRVMCVHERVCMCACVCMHAQVCASQSVMYVGCSMDCTRLVMHLVITFAVGMHWGSTSLSKPKR